MSMNLSGKNNGLTVSQEDPSAKTTRNHNLANEIFFLPSAKAILLSDVSSSELNALLHLFRSSFSYNFPKANLYFFPSKENALKSYWTTRPPKQKNHFYSNSNILQSIKEAYTGGCQLNNAILFLNHHSTHKKTRNHKA